MSLGEDIVKNLANLADQSVAAAVAKAEEKFTAFEEQTRERVEKLFASRPVLHVKVGDGQTYMTSKRQGKQLPRLIANAKMGLYSLMVGPAGCGKTTMAHQVAESLGLQFGAVCLTAGASETWLFGRQTPNGFVEGPFSKIYREGGVFLADEVDAADANLLLSINTALSHDVMLNPMSGEMIKKHDNFVFIGAANTNGKGASHVYTGRSRLDAATLDRFIVIHVDYDVELEKELCQDVNFYHYLQAVRVELKKQAYDEFISSRQFDFCNRQLKNKIPVSDVCDSLTANWGQAAQELAKKVWRDGDYGKGRVPGKAKKGAAQDDFFSYVQEQLESRKGVTA